MVLTGKQKKQRRRELGWKTTIVKLPKRYQIVVRINTGEVFNKVITAEDEGELVSKSAEWLMKLSDEVIERDI